MTFKELNEATADKWEALQAAKQSKPFTECHAEFDAWKALSDQFMTAIVERGTRGPFLPRATGVVIVHH